MSETKDDDIRDMSDDDLIAWLRELEDHRRKKPYFFEEHPQMEKAYQEALAEKIRRGLRMRR